MTLVSESGVATHQALGTVWLLGLLPCCWHSERAVQEPAKQTAQHKHSPNSRALTSSERQQPPGTHRLRQRQVRLPDHGGTTRHHQRQQPRSNKPAVTKTQHGSADLTCGKWLLANNQAPVKRSGACCPQAKARVQPSEA